MHDAPLVRRFQGFGDLSRDRHNLVQWNRSGRDAIRQRRTVDQLQDERVHTIGILETVDRRDIWMIERCEDLCFPPEAREPVSVLRSTDGWWQHFDRDVTAEPRVVRSIHLTHAAASD